MNKKVLAAVIGLSLIAGVAFAAKGKAKDWHDLDNAHKHLVQVINEMGRARAKNHYDMAGHGAKAEDLAKQAEAELKLAVEAAKQESAKPAQ